MSRPSVSDVSAFLTDLAEYRRCGVGDYAELMSRKAELLEGIAADRPGDTEAAEVAVIARTRANELPS